MKGAGVLSGMIMSLTIKSSDHNVHLSPDSCVFSCTLARESFQIDLIFGNPGRPHRSGVSEKGMTKIAVREGRPWTKMGNLIYVEESVRARSGQGGHFSLTGKEIVAESIDRCQCQRV
jgi:hypothetical protein